MHHFIDYWLKVAYQNRFSQIRRSLYWIIPCLIRSPAGKYPWAYVILHIYRRLSTTGHTLLATYADDTTILASHENPIEASRILQMHLDQFEEWLKRWRIKANETKSVHITFALRPGTRPPVQLNGTSIPQEESIKYLGLDLDRRLTWRTHILAKRKQLDIKFSKMYWLIGRKSELTTENKILVYTTILKPVWT
jgi:hypothetical protein